MAVQAVGMDMGGAVPMDMHSSYEAYEVPQPENLDLQQQAEVGGEHPAEQLRRLQEEAAQLAAQQSQVSVCAVLHTSCCHLMHRLSSDAIQAVLSAHAAHAEGCRRRPFSMCSLLFFATFTVVLCGASRCAGH